MLTGAFKQVHADSSNALTFLCFTPIHIGYQRLIAGIDYKLIDRSLKSLAYQPS